MKIKIFASVIVAHLLVAMIVAYSGCQSSQSTKTAADTRMAPEQGYSQSGETLSDTSRPSSNYVQPTPVASAPSNQELDSAFNSGSTMSTSQAHDGDLYAPTRPAWESQGPALNEFREDEVLDPLEVFDAPQSSVYTVKRGDSLWKIAKNNGVSFQALLKANDMNKDSTIFPGQELTIPAGQSQASSSANTESGSADTEKYVVKRGDTLSRIATKFNTTVKDLKMANGLKSDVIRLNQKLTIPVNSRSVPRSSTTSSSTPVSSNNTASRQVVDGYIVHIVKSGETPIIIARMYGITTAQLMRDNGIDDPRKMRVGQELQIRLIGAQTPVSNTPVETPEYDPAELTTPTRPETNVETPEDFEDDYFDDFDNIPEVEVIEEE